MRTAIIIGIWLLYWLVNIAIARWNNYIRLRRIKKGNHKQIEHPLWAAFYAGLCLIPFIWYRSWWQFISLGALHGSVFPVAWNIFQGNGTPIFFLSKTSKALFDRFQVWIGLSSSELFNLSCMAISAASMILQIFI